MNMPESLRLPFPAMRALWLALPLAALLPGCPVYLGPGERPACEMTSECPSGLECIGGRCTSTVECSATVACPAGEVCNAGTCEPGPTTCRTHGDCAPGAMCDAGICEPSTLCTVDSECDTGFWCDFRGTCVPRDPAACRTTADCDTSEICIEGSCRARTDTCQFDYQCPAGSSCVNAECTDVCTTDSDCAAGDVCTDHFCRAGQDCTTSATCATGEHCVDARCLPDCRTAGCAAGSYCDEDQFCHPSWQEEPFCSFDSDCQTGRVCRMGVCRTPCETMTDAECMTIDATLPLCRLDSAIGDYFCAATDAAPECHFAEECTAPESCVNAICR